MKRKIINLLIILVLVLTLTSAASAQTSSLRQASQSITVNSITSAYTGDKDTRGENRLDRSINAVGELQPVSVVVTFNRSVDPNRLATVTGGQVVHRYKKVFNGASLLVGSDKLGTLAAQPGVTGVYIDKVLQIQTEESPQFIGAPAIWSQLGGQGSAGEGVVVGIIDTGIWPEHPSFSDPDPSGKPYAAPPGGPYACDFGNTGWNANDAPFTCNNKLIGAYEFMDTYKLAVGLDPLEFDSARDSDGHGSHTSSTAAGNWGVAASILGTYFGDVSGVAPRAHVIMYRVCGGPTGSCYSSDSAAAIDQAILDGVDVLNFSIGGGETPYSDIVSLAFLAAYDNGIFVAASAGNSGPGADTVGHREPWVTTAAASTQSRTFLGTIDLLADNNDALHLDGVSIGGAASGEIVIGADYGNALCGSVEGVNPFPPNTFTSNQIVVCARGITARVEKSGNVMNSGGGGVILYNPTINSLNADNHFVPTVHIGNAEGATLLSFLASHTVVTGTIQGGIKVFEQGDVVAAFSSRGGPGQSLGISKPDIAAPGVNILAAHTPLNAFPITGGTGAPGNLFHAIGGTSMASPHIAGSGALLKALYPSWTPGQIKSALMMTATPSLEKEDGVTKADQFDIGSGRVNLNVAANRPGITISDTAAGYIARESDLWNSNYPSLYIPVMPGVMTVQRTVHSELPVNAVWNLSVASSPDLKISVPSRLRVGAGADVTFDITVDAHLVPLGAVRHAYLFFNRSNNILRFPITIVRGQPAVSMEKYCTPDRIMRGEGTNCTINIVNNGFTDADVSVQDVLPAQLALVRSSLIGGTASRNGVIRWSGTLGGAVPPDVTVVDGTGTSPAGGYLPLAPFGTPPLPGADDEVIYNLGVPPFVFAGKTWDTIGMVSNGYAVVGGGDASDINFINQVLPDTARPNNVLAPFWTDLDPSSGGDMLADILTDGTNFWLILEWDGVSTWSGDDPSNTFQIWIGLNGYEDVSFVYGPVGDGDGGWLTVGAENEFGTSGQNWYVDGVGTPVASGDELRVVSAGGGSGESHTISFTALGRLLGKWTNCATMTSNVFEGVSTACYGGLVYH